MFELYLNPILLRFFVVSFFISTDYLSVKLTSKTFFNLFYTTQIIKFLLDNNTLLNEQL